MRTSLAHGITSTDVIVTVASGCLVKGMDLALDLEACVVTETITPTQAKVLRGQHGTMAAAHDVGTSIWGEPPEQPARQRVVSHGEQPMGACPTCGRGY